MNVLMRLLLPALILFSLVYGAVKKVGVYDSFADGVKDAFSLTLTVFPYLATIFVMTELMESSGLSATLTKLLTPVFSFLGIPEELCRLVLLKPFSGSGSLALLSEIYAAHGPDSYIAHCASCIFGSSETVFYISAVYFSKCRNKKPVTPVIISLAAGFLSCIFACLICRIL